MAAKSKSRRRSVSVSRTSRSGRRRTLRISASRRGISASSRRSPSRRRSSQSALSRMMELPREMGTEALRVVRRSLPI